jgi:GNAT superfamily N-acetyltransferase
VTGDGVTGDGVTGDGVTGDGVSEAGADIPSTGAPAHVNLECVPETFRPDAGHAVRWLDAEADYPLARDFWFIPISREDWLGFRAEGYGYAAAVEGGRIVSLAAVWRYSDAAWEAAGVATRPDARRRGYGRAAVSFVTAAILGAGRRATCLTAADNVAMQRTAQSVGYYFAPRR